MSNLTLSARAEAVQHSFSGGRKYRWLPLWLLLPSILVLLALQVYPTLYSVYLSTTRVRRGEFMYVGLANFERLLRTPSFIESLRTSLVYSTTYIILTVSLGLMLALLLNRRFKFTGFYLVIIFIPWVISEVVAGTMWRWLFQRLTACCSRGSICTRRSWASGSTLRRAAL